MGLVSTAAICLLLSGCTLSKAERGPRHAKGDFTVTPPGYFTPLPGSTLLGARSLEDRDAISVALIRRLATKPCDVKPDIKYRFIGFQGYNGAQHDPSEELLQRIRKLRFRVEPISAQMESRMQDGMRVESEQSTRGIMYFIIYISMRGEDRAEAGVNECPGSDGGGQRFTYWLARRGGEWTITNEEPGPIF